jgi:hypothetical protein
MSNVYEAGKNQLDHAVWSTLGYVPEEWDRKERSDQACDMVEWKHRVTHQYVIVIRNKETNAYPKVVARILKDNLDIDTRFKLMEVTDPNSDTRKLVVSLELADALEMEGKHFWFIRTIPQPLSDAMGALVDELVRAIYVEI